MEQLNFYRTPQGTFCWKLIDTEGRTKETSCFFKTFEACQSDALKSGHLDSQLEPVDGETFTVTTPKPDPPDEEVMGATSRAPLDPPSEEASNGKPVVGIERKRKTRDMSGSNARALNDVIRGRILVYPNRYGGKWDVFYPDRRTVRSRTNIDFSYALKIQDMIKGWSKATPMLHIDISKWTKEDINTISGIIKKHKENV